MSEQKKIIVQHDINLGELDRLEKALKGISKGADSGRITAELGKQVKAHEKKILLEQKELGLIEKLIVQQKNLRRFQKYAQTEKELKSINQRLKENRKALTAAKNTTQGWAKALDSFQFKFNFLANTMAFFARGAARAFNQAMKEAVTTVKEFESAMAGVKAISGATAEQFKRLRDDAIRLGGATIFTARQVAELQINYAKLGFSTQEILNATEATLSLAAATDEGLAASALVAGSTLRAFGLEAQQTQRVTDVMAKSFTSSALNLENFTEAMKFLAPVAKQAGLTIEDTTAILGTLADTGLKGSIAGTSLRNIFLRMADSSSALSRRFGYTVRSGEDFIRMLKTMQDEGIDLAEALELTNLRAVTAFSTLADQGEKVEALSRVLENSFGAAAEMANIRMDTLQGSITIMKSAWEGLVISVESGHAPLTRGLRSVIDMFTTLINKIKVLTYTHEEAINAIGAEAAATKFKSFSRDQAGLSPEEILVNINKETAAYTKLFNQQTENIAWKKKRMLELAEGNEDLTQLATDGFFRGLITGADNVKKSKLIQEYLDDITELEKYTIGYEKYLDRLATLQVSVELGQEKTTKESEAATSGIIAAPKLEDLKKNIKTIIDFNKRIVDTQAAINFENRKKEISELDIHEEKKKELISIAAKEQLAAKYEAELEYLNVLKDLLPEERELIYKQIDLIQAKISNLDFTPGAGGDEDDPEKGIFGSLVKQAIRSSEVVIDILDEVNDAEIRASQMRIDRYNTEVSELQRSLEQQYDLQKEGKANRVTLLEQEIKETQEKREREYKQQEKLERQKRIMQSLTQASNVATAITNIWVAETPKGTAGVILAVIETAAMLASLALSFSQIDQTLPKYAEGGWVDGKRHSQGGTVIEAEVGEYVLSRGEASVFDKMLKSLGADNMTDAWDTIQGVSKKGNSINVVTNSKRVEELLSEILTTNKEAPKDFGDYIEFEYKGSKYRFKK